MYSLLSFSLLFLVWIVFSGKFDWFHLTLGILSAAFVTYFSSDLYFTDRRIGFLERLRQSARFCSYLVWLLYQIFLANLHVLRLALWPNALTEIDPVIVRMKTYLRSEFARYVLANSITLTPGTITLKIEEDILYIHAISRKAASSLDGEMERRIAAVFENSKKTKDE